MNKTILPNFVTLSGRPSKAFFAWCSSLSGVPLLNLYREFLMQHVCGGMDSNFAMQASEEELRDMYGADESDPLFFRFDNNSDMGKLTNIVEASVVIYSPVFVRKKFKGAIKRYDNRSWRRLTGGRQEGDKDHVFCLSPRGGDLEYWPNPPFWATGVPLQGEFFLKCQVRTAVSRARGCYLEALALLLGEEAVTELRVMSTKSCPSLAELAVRDDEVERLAGAAGVGRLIIVIHLCSGGYARSYKAAGQQEFHMLADVGSKSTPKVVCASEPDFLFFLDSKYAVRFVRDFNRMRRKRMAKVEGGRSTLPMAKKRKPDPKRSKKRRLGWEEEKRKTPPCGCQTCLEGEKYNTNFPRVPAQRLYTTDLDLPAFMDMFNFTSDDDWRTYRQCCDLTISALDVETIRRDVHAVTGDSLNRRRTVTDLRYSSAARSVQCPVLFHHTDFLDCADPSEGQPSGRMFRVGSKAKERGVIRSYLYYVQERAMLACELKSKLLKKMLDFTASLGEAHAEFFVEVEGDRNEGGFHQTLPGMFRKKLQKFAKV